MSSDTSPVSFEIVKHRGTPKPNESGSIFYAYVDAIMTIAGVSVRIRNLTLRKTQLGKFHVTFPEEIVELNGVQKRIPVIRPEDADARKQLTAAMRTAFAAYVTAGNIPQLHAVKRAA